jgi:hypothetical protein
MQSKSANEIKSFGDVRMLILETITGIRDGGLTVTEGMAIAANFKELNNNMQCEINAMKLALATQGTAHEFGRIKKMGTTLIGNNEE